jgi:glycosyltransferase involved in cell wall biosynthesis
MTAPQRILHLINHARDSGNGIVNTAVDLACGQRALGAEVAVASAGGSFDRLLQANGVVHYPMRSGRRPQDLWHANTDLRAILRRFRAQIVHAHMLAPALLALVAKVPHRHCLVTSVHNEFERGAVLMGLGQRVIAVSEAVAASLRRRGVPGARIRVVRNGPLGSVRAAAVAVEPPALRRPAIVTVGGLYRRKGVDVLIAAFHRLAAAFPTGHLYIVGDGPDRALFETLARTGPGASRIHFEGFRSGPMAYMRAADIFVLASRREPFGLVLAEARSAGAAIVATGVDGIPEVLDGGQAGRLVPPDDASALARALGDLLADPQQLAFWRARAAKNLDWLGVERMCRETCAVYADALHGRAHEAAAEPIAGTRAERHAP